MKSKTLARAQRDELDETRTRRSNEETAFSSSNDAVWRSAEEEEQEGVETMAFLNETLASAMGVIDGPAVQPKLKVSAPDDPQEREADRVAEELTSGAGQVDVRRAPEGGASGAGAMTVSAGAISSLGGGEALPDGVRERFEPRLGMELGGVRVHTGPSAASAARSIRAKAFTLGKDIAFGEGEWAPGTPRGDRLLAHELAHVVHTKGSNTQTLVRRQEGTVSDEDDEIPIGDSLEEQLNEVNASGNPAELLYSEVSEEEYSYLDYDGVDIDSDSDEEYGSVEAIETTKGTIIREKCDDGNYEYDVTADRTRPGLHPLDNYESAIYKPSEGATSGGYSRHLELYYEGKEDPVTIPLSIIKENQEWHGENDHPFVAERVFAPRLVEAKEKVLAVQHEYDVGIFKQVPHIMLTLGAAGASGTSSLVSQSRRLAARSLPQGLSRSQFSRLSLMVRKSAGHLSDDIAVQGSRARGFAGPESDLDIAVRVTKKRFDKIVRARFGNPKLGTAKYRTMQHAINSGKITSGKAGLHGLRKELEREMKMKVQISVILEGSKFDTGPFIPLI